MKCIAVPIDVEPEVSYSQQEETRPCQQVPGDRLRQSDQLSIGLLRAQPPGNHAQGLAATGPEPGIKRETADNHHQKQHRILNRISFDTPIYYLISLGTKQKLDEVSQYHPNGYHQESIVK